MHLRRDGVVERPHEGIHLLLLLLLLEEALLLMHQRKRLVLVVRSQRCDMVGRGRRAVDVRQVRGVGRRR